MRIKLRVLYRSPQVGVFDADEFFAADNWKVEMTWTGNSSSGQRSTGALRVDWDHLVDAKTEQTVRLTKVYAPGEWASWESLPE